VTGIVLFQPEGPGAGFTVGVIVGGVGFVFVLVTVSWVGNPRRVRSDVARVCVFPTASDRITEFTVYVPFSLVLGKVAVAVPVTEVLGVKVADAVCVDVVEGLRKFA
jgi:hypothetical protein